MKKLLCFAAAVALLAPGLACAQSSDWQAIHQDNRAINQNTANLYQDKGALAAEDAQQQQDIASGNLLGAVLDNQQIHKAKHDVRVDAANINAAEQDKYAAERDLHQSEYDRMRARQEIEAREARERREEEERWTHDRDHHDWHDDGDHHDHDHDHDHDWHDHDWHNN